MKIMVFLHGTIIMHANAVDCPRHERVQQVIEGEDSVSDFASYVPVGNAAKKLCEWQEQGADISYFTFRTAAKDIEQDKSVLRRHGFPDGEVFYRRDGQQYKDIAERIMPDILIEDDCESIGGQEQMIYPHIKPELQARIESIVIKEFSGIDHLSDSITLMFSIKAKKE